jgi:lipopolysaccharide transport system ATP-binding protein
MSNTVIRVENISKQYRLGKIGTGTLTHDVNRWWHSVRGKEDPYLKIGEVNDRSKKGSSEYVWALKDVSFDVEQGDVLGIIGKNGAGKSTLLKILSRTTLPTRGSIKIKGRVASLLEVGTGFHPDLTGRENIFLNGAILGMRKAEITRKFDEIVDFAGIEKYIDTPVKRYSSGMYVRLAFAVAAHLEPEILIVDEVLAVGDAEFQNKALGKMQSVSSNEGRTVIFVSHNMAAMQSLCKKCVLMKHGLILDGPDVTDRIITNYLRGSEVENVNVNIRDRKDREGEGELRISDVKIINRQGEEQTSLISGQQATFRIEFENVKGIYDDALLEVAISISRRGEHLVTMMNTKFQNFQLRNTRDNNSVNFYIEALPFMTGGYSINVMIRKSSHNIQDWLKEAKFFDVQNGDYYRTGQNLPESHRGVYIDYMIK